MSDVTRPEPLTAEQQQRFVKEAFADMHRRAKAELLEWCEELMRTQQAQLSSLSPILTLAPTSNPVKPGEPRLDVRRIT